MMLAGTFEHVGVEQGVLALNSIGVNDWTSFDCGSFDTTNTPVNPLRLQPSSAPLQDVDAKLREATDLYDDLLRRLAD